MKNRLQIYLITYDRKKLLEKTLEQIFDESSPICGYDITILDNASTDGTSELIEEYAKRFSNIKHIRHSVNIGGNANICRAYELAAHCGKEYAWVLCDDDFYDFSNWKEVEENIQKGKDIICLADYSFPSVQDKENKVCQLFQLTFVPACIFRTDIITDSVLMNMYESIFTMFQQLCPVIKVINNAGEIHVLSKPVVFNGMKQHSGNHDVSFTRGSEKTLVTERKRKTIWMLGFVNILTLLDDKTIIGECVEASVLFKDIHGSWEKFYRCLCRNYFNFKSFSYFYEIFKVLKLKRKLGFVWYLLTGWIRFFKLILKTLRFKYLFG